MDLTDAENAKLLLPDGTTKEVHLASVRQPEVSHNGIFNPKTEQVIDTR